MINRKHFIYLALIIVLVSTVRWNRQDIFIRQYVGYDDKQLGDKVGYDVEMSLDSYNYLQYVNYYRGKDVESEVTKPYSFRFLVPLIAAYLPLDPFSSLNIINLSTEILGLLFLMKVLALIGFNSRTTFITAFFYSFSFPVFYYGVVGLLDAPAIFLIMLGVYLTFKRRWLPLTLLLIVGAMVNEKVVLLVPFYFFFSYKEIGFGRSLLRGTCLFALFVVSTLLIRKLTINADSAFIWQISFDSLVYNLSRVRTYISLLLTGGVPMLLLLLSCKRIDFGNIYNFALLSGVVLVLVMIVYSLTAAYTDGRFMWYVYPFALPLGAVFIEQKVSTGRVD
jgi:hypothetical protein